MPDFSYNALTPTGEPQTGERTAPSASALAGELEREGLLVRRIRPRRVALGGPRTRSGSREGFALFNQELLALLKAGLTVPDALATVADRKDAPRFAAVLRRVLAEVRAGARPSEACAHYPEVFDAPYVAALRTGERTGNLVTALARYQRQLREQIALRKRISQAMAYPVFLLAVLAVIVGVLLVFVMPRFVVVYADFRAELPWPTQALLQVVTHLGTILPALAVGIAGGWMLLRGALRTHPGRRAWGRFRQRLPLVGRWYRAALVAQFAHTMGSLLGGGTPVTEAMHTTQAALADADYAERVERAALRITEGMSMARALESEAVMPTTGLKLVEAGEASGSLEAMLDEVARYYDEVLQHNLARLMALVEPTLMLAMGLIVGGIILVMYLPIFHLADVIR